MPCHFCKVAHPYVTIVQFAGLSDVSISEDIPVEGEINVPVGSPSRQEDEYSTLDEPVKDTIVRCS